MRQTLVYTYSITFPYSFYVWVCVCVGLDNVYFFYTLVKIEWSKSSFFLIRLFITWLSHNLWLPIEGVKKWFTKLVNSVKYQQFACLFQLLSFFNILQITHRTFDKLSIYFIYIYTKSIDRSISVKFTHWYSFLCIKIYASHTPCMCVYCW